MESRRQCFAEELKGLGVGGFGAYGSGFQSVGSR